MIAFTDIENAAKRLAGHISRTPLIGSEALGGEAGVSLFLKCESLQKTGSFKPRGALNKILSLTEAERAPGLITVSAGNHAQAVAWAAREVGSRCTVVMPADAPSSKVAAVRGYGAEIISHDDRATLFERLEQEQDRRGSFFIHPFDDPVVLAGAGTTGVEIVEALPDVDVVLVPVGGGGLLGGVASAVKHLRPAARVVAVELEDGPGLKPALEAGSPITVPRPYGTIADGMTPPFVGRLPLSIAKTAVDDIALVSEGEIIDAICILMSQAKLYVEGSGAATMAALIAGKVDCRRGARVAAIVSGGNIDLDTMCDIVSNR